MNFTNKHIVLIILIIIIVVFVVHYDVYVIPKNEPLCKPIFVIKRELSPEVRAKLNKTEKMVFREAVDNIANNNIFEGFDNSDLKIPDKSICTYSVKEMKNSDKIKVIDSVCNVIAYIPTPLRDEDIKDIINYYAIMYDNSSDLDNFFEKVQEDFEKNKDPMMKSKYAQLVLFLIGRSDIKNNIQINNDSILQDNNSEVSKNDEISKKVVNMIEKKIKKKLKKMNERQQNVNDIPIDINSSYDQNKNFNYSNEFDVEQIKSMGGFNLNDGPSSYEMSDPVDRISQSTRIGPYHHKELIYNDNMQKPGNSFYVSNFKNQLDSYTDKAKDYLRNETCSSDNYNSSTQAYNLF